MDQRRRQVSRRGVCGVSGPGVPGQPVRVGADAADLEDLSCRRRPCKGVHARVDPFRTAVVEIGYHQRGFGGSVEIGDEVADTPRRSLSGGRDVGDRRARHRRTLVENLDCLRRTVSALRGEGHTAGVQGGDVAVVRTLRRH